MALPTSWDHVLKCACYDCRALSAIYRKCVADNEPLFVIDTRMYGQGWQVANINDVFVRAADPDQNVPMQSMAVAQVLVRQKHCSVYLSSFPAKVPEVGYVWAMHTEYRP